MEGTSLAKQAAARSQNHNCELQRADRAAAVFNSMEERKEPQPAVVRNIRKKGWIDAGPTRMILG
jgi:hypothetical protein